MNFLNQFFKPLTILFLLTTTLLHAQDYDQDMDRASVFYQKGINAKNHYQLDSADFYLKEAAALFKKHEAWENYLILQNEIGSILLAKGQLDNAISFFENELDEASVHFEANNEYSANLYNNLGLAHFLKGDIDEALDIYDRALSIRIAIGDKESVFMSNLFNDMGNGYSEKGEYELALDYYQKALKIRKKQLGENHPETALSYNNLGIIYEAQGQYDMAIQYHQKAVQIQKNIFGEDYPELAKYYRGIGNAYMDKSELDLAMSYYMKAYTINQKTYGDSNPVVAKDLIAIGNVYTTKDDYENAIDAFQKALKIQKNTLSANHPDLAMTYNNIGNVYNKNEEYDLALAFYMNALQIKESVVGPEHPEIADYYNNIGNIYSSKREYELALDYQQKGLDLKIMFFGNRHPAVVLPYLNMGNIYYELGEYNKALVQFQNSLSANVKDFNPEASNYYANPVLNNYYDAQKLLSSLQGKAKAFVGRYKTDTLEANLITAFKTYQKCDTLIGIIRKTTISKSDKIELGKIASKVYDEGIDVCAKLHKLNKDTDNGMYLHEGFYFSEKNKAGVLLEAIAAAEAKKFSGLPDSLLAIEKAEKEHIAFYEKKLAETFNAEDERDIRNKLFELKKEYNKLIAGFERDYPKYYEMKHSKSFVTVKELQKILPDDVAIRSYFIGDNSISIFTLTTDSIFFDQVEKEDDFDFKVFGLRKLITSGAVEDIQNYQSESFEFYNKLFPKTLPVNINKLLIIPDGNLGLIPFEGLLFQQYSGDVADFASYPYLIKKYGIAYSYSANLFYKNIKRTVSTENSFVENNWLGIAPVFNSDRKLVVNDIYISPLPATEHEVKTINQEFKQTNLPSDYKMFDEASEAFLKSDSIKKYKFLHIATHGFVNSEKPELSGIILSDTKSGGNDGVLYSGEIYNLDLHSDLVVLSACETGLGKISKGEGIIGLTRALLYAGTNNIIVSLWKVSDNSTSKLMIDFYENMLKEKDDKEAKFAYLDYLREAKLNMIKDKKFGHPFFWSPFILIGN